MPVPASLPAIRSVLIVDDSAAQRAYAVALCHELGIADIHEAGNGQEALALLSALPAPPDLLIIDLEMPTMDGPELLVHLRERGLESPIIVVSSREQSLLHSVKDMGIGMGLCLLGALQKPLHLESFSNILRNWDSVADRRKQSARALPLEPDELHTGMDRGEIVVHYQPQIAVRSGDVHGVEALARWNHPTLGPSVSGQLHFHGRRTWPDSPAHFAGDEPSHAADGNVERTGHGPVGRHQSFTAAAGEPESVAGDRRAATMLWAACRADRA